jgi:Transcription factor homologous to NACalpha-BTF3|uniref:Nascent polypeptide-associated complex protein n=1 Tax=Ignisphaera aggregans TaxID=334771 RepID=A0A7J3Z703_9CREN
MFNPRELQKQLKQLKRMGMKIDQLQNVRKAVIELQDKQIVVENPEVMVMEFANQKFFYISGSVKEVLLKSGEEISAEAITKVSDEDVQFVAEYLGVSREDAMSLLNEAKGDIAKAIELGQARKGVKS